MLEPQLVTVGREELSARRFIVNRKALLMAVAILKLEMYPNGFHIQFGSTHNETSVTPDVSYAPHDLFPTAQSIPPLLISSRHSTACRRPGGES